MDGQQFTRGKGCRNRKLTDADRAEIVRLYTTPLPDGTWMGVVSIARLYGVANHCIQDRLKRAGVKMRSRQESNVGKRCKPITNLPVGEAPSCKCGCGDLTGWNQRKNRWNRYVGGHYRPAAKHNNEAWLREQYVMLRRTTWEIAKECGVGHSSILKQMQKFGIPRRSRSESRRGRNTGPDNYAWKGGISGEGYSSDWKMVSRSIRARDNWTCQRCGKQQKYWDRALHVHHIDTNKLNNDPTNLITLCDRCHGLAHAALRGAAQLSTQ